MSQAHRHMAIAANQLRFPSSCVCAYSAAARVGLQRGQCADKNQNEGKGIIDDEKIPMRADYDLQQVVLAWAPSLARGGAFGCPL